MIEEIIRLRGDGLSFRKIASELNTTVGKVHYRWNKWIDSAENELIDNNDIQVEKDTKSSSTHTSPKYIPLKGELNAKLITPRKMILFWDVSNIPKKIIELYFNRNLDNFVHVVRIYDVTEIVFNGKNSHHFNEITVPYDNGHWFIKGLVANRSYVAELGINFSDNDFFPLFRSNRIQTPNMELPNGNELNRDFLQFQQYEDRPPKWIDHVSTYSYYGESNSTEEKNG